MFLQHSPIRPFVAVLGSLIGACLAQAAPDSVSLIEEPFVESFKFVHDGGVADDTVRPAPEDAPFDGPVVEVAVTEAPAKNWLVRLQGRSETAINEGDKVVVEFYTKLLQSDDDSGQLFFFAQVGGSEFPFRLKTYPDSEWGSAYGTFTAPRTYAPGELLFNMNLGFKAQTLQVGGVKIDKFPSSANVKDLLSQKLVGEEIEFDFDGGFSSVRNRNYKGEVGGEIPGGMKDNTAWADADVHYSKFTENPYAGGGALRVEVGDIRKGFVQLLRPEVGLTQDASTRIEIATRSASGTQMVVGFRQGSAPYKRLWEATVESGPDWRKQRLMVPPVTNDPDADFYLGFREAGQVDIDELTIGFLSTEEQKAQLDGNLAPVSSFPLGLVPPVAPAHHDFRPENYRVDRSEAGPTGMPAIRLEPTEQFQGKGHYWLRFAKELPPGQYTLSVYAKGERPSQGLSLRIGPPSERHWEAPYAKNIRISDEWERYSATFNLPASPDGFYVATIVTSRTTWLDGIQLEKGTAMTEFQRSGQIEIGAQALPRPYGLVYENQPLAARVALYGQGEPGMRLHSKLVDLDDNAIDLPVRDLADEDFQLVRLSANEVGELPFGTYNLVMHVTDREGERISPFAEVLLHRIRAPRRPDEFAPDSPFGTQMDPVKPIVETVRQLGFKWVRTWDLYWRDLEPTKGDWQWDRTDRAMDLLHDNYFNVMAIAGSIASHANDAPDNIRQKWVGHNLIPDEMDLWEGYVNSIVSRYKDSVQVWEIWNEPYWTKYLPGSFTEDGKAVHATPEQFFELFTSGAEAAKEADPDAKLAWNSSAGEMMEWDKEVIDLGILEYLDIVTIHKYTNSSIGYPGDPIYREVQHLKENLPAEYRDIPIWNTEGGWHAMIRNASIVHPPQNLRSEVRRNANFQIGYYMSTLGSGVDKFFNFIFSDWGRYRGTWSLFNDDSQLSATAVALSNMIWHLDGLDFQGFEEIDTEVFAYLFEGTDRAAAVIIGKGAGRTKLDTLPAEARLNGLFGNPVSLPATLGNDATFLFQENASVEDLLQILRR